MLGKSCLLSLSMLLCGELIAGQNIVIVLDDSGSMGEPLRSDRRTQKIDAARSALRTVLEQLPDDSQVGVLVLNGEQDAWLIPLAPIDKAEVNSVVGRIRASGGTPLGSSIKIAADALLQARAKQHYGTYKLLIVTDGEAGDKELVEQYLPDIISRGLVVDVIGVDMQQTHSLATKVQTYRRADDARSLEQAISEVVLGESSADTSDAGESDFEILQGLPSEVAVVILNTLANQGNQPIGPQRPAATFGSGEQQLPPGGPFDSVPNVPMPRSAPAGVRGTWSTVFSFLCACSLAVIVLAGVGILLVVKSSGRR
ncbi:MAG: VWA domain-containing protein [Planctomycetota bacterium]|nr:VWA domain-containing protein [Planctomycetota bacterium]